MIKLMESGTSVLAVVIFLVVLFSRIKNLIFVIYHIIWYIHKQADSYR